MKFTVIFSSDEVNQSVCDESDYSSQIKKIISCMVNRGHEIVRNVHLGEPISKECIHYGINSLARRIDRLSQVDFVLVFPKYEDDEIAKLEFNIALKNGIYIRKISIAEYKLGILLEERKEQKYENHDKSADEL